MNYKNVDCILSEKDILEIESELNITFPKVLREHYLYANGGSPEKYVFEDDSIDTVVAEILPLKSHSGRGTVVNAYNSLVVTKKLVEKFFVPFAIDGGGDYFFINTQSQSGSVFFFKGDSWANGENDYLVDLKLTFAEFMSSLKSEDE
jgi:hypothetical protein